MCHAGGELLPYAQLPRLLLRGFREQRREVGVLFRGRLGKHGSGIVRGLGRSALRRLRRGGGRLRGGAQRRLAHDDGHLPLFLLPWRPALPLRGRWLRRLRSRPRRSLEDLLEGRLGALLRRRRGLRLLHRDALQHFLEGGLVFPRALLLLFRLVAHRTPSPAERGRRVIPHPRPRASAGGWRERQCGAAPERSSRMTHIAWATVLSLVGLLRCGARRSRPRALAA